MQEYKKIIKQLPISDKDSKTYLKKLFNKQLLKFFKFFKEIGEKIEKEINEETAKEVQESLIIAYICSLVYYSGMPQECQKKILIKTIEEIDKTKD